MNAAVRTSKIVGQLRAANSIFPDWYNDLLTILTTIGLAIATIKWARKNRSIIRKSVFPLFAGTILAITLVLQLMGGNEGYLYIIGRVTAVWGPAGPPPPTSSSLNPIFPILVTVACVSAITLYDLRRLVSVRELPTRFRRRIRQE